MVFTNNINALVGALILLSHWNQDLYSIFNKNFDQKKTGLIFTQAYFFGGGGGDGDDDGKKNEKKDKEVVEEYDFDSERLVATLSNSEKIPYIGLGLGNVEDVNIPELITAAFTSTSEDKEMNNLGYRLIDTGRVSGNEKLISETLALISKNNKNASKSAAPIHIVTKVWYTHLGYERTKISIQESLDDILGPLKERKFLNFKIHFLIHWPRCYEDGDEGKNCVQEENDLPSYVKEAGETIPQENAFAFLGSWRAMEDMYNMHFPTIASIGVSNFDEEQLQMLLQAARIKPHTYQGNFEITYKNLDVLRHHEIHAQLYGVFSSLTSKRKVKKLDVARRQLVSLAGEISTEEREIYPASLLLSFLLKESMGVMVRTSSQENLMQNSPKSLLQVPNELSVVQSDRLVHILDSIQYHWKEEEDEEKFAEADEKVHVSFHNNLSLESPISILFVEKDENGMEVQNSMVAEEVMPWEIFTIESHPGHTFKAFDAGNGNEIAKFEVDAPYGKAQWFSVEL